MSRRTYSDDLKAAVMAQLLQGQSVSSIATEYDIPKGTVSGWKRKAKEHAADSPLASDATQKEEIGQLLVDYLRANLDALRAQSEVFADRDWLKDQEASELAVLHGVMTDKAVRLLEALAGADVDGAP